MDEILFPHDEVRDVQDKFLKDVFEALNKDKNAIVHAPTGLGKTTILGPVLKYALDNKKTVFFLTPMHSQHKIALETLRKIKQKHKISFLGVDLIGKKWMCPHAGTDLMTSSEFSEYCKEFINKNNCEYYHNMKTKNKLSFEAKKLLKELKMINPKDVEDVIRICSNKKLCPYDFSCLLAKEADVIIGDYFHVLSEHIRNHLFSKIDKSVEDCIFIFDEAHNLPSKARDLMTVNLSGFVIDGAVKEAKDLGYEGMSKEIKELSLVLEELVREKMSIEDNEVLITREEFLERVENYFELKDNLVFLGEKALEEKKKSFCLSVMSFLEAWPGKDEGFTRILSKGFGARGRPVINIAYKCMDPSFVMEGLKEGRIICMSGTLTPVKMYEDLLEVEGFLQEYEDPFPGKNRLNLIVPKTTTKFTRRSNEMFQKIAVVSSRISNAIKGNVAVFFPSYEILGSVKAFFDVLSEKTIFTENKGMNKMEKDDMLENYKSYSKQGAVLLGVSSGSYSEGIDLPGEFLNGVIVVGLPLGKPDLETQELIKYYDERFGRGWDYGYIYPAILRTMQNAGRCIRSSEDRGVVVFLDERFSWDNYLRCFPKEWKMNITRMPVSMIEEFFSKDYKEKDVDD